jgi:hypothetical protein
MDATRISSTPAVVGVVSSAASMPRIFKPQSASLIEKLQAQAMVHYRQAQVERHLREYLQRGADGRYFNTAGLNLYDLVTVCAQSTASAIRLLLLLWPRCSCASEPAFSP